MSTSYASERNARGIARRQGISPQAAARFLEAAERKMAAREAAKTRMRRLLEQRKASGAGKSC